MGIPCLSAPSVQGMLGITLANLIPAIKPVEGGPEPPAGLHTTKSVFWAFMYLTVSSTCAVGHLPAILVAGVVLGEFCVVHQPERHYGMPNALNNVAHSVACFTGISARRATLHCAMCSQWLPFEGEVCSSCRAYSAQA